jgi:hypothetical protein
MPRILTGRVIEFDKFKRFRIVFAEADARNTRAQLAAYDGSQTGWSPVNRAGFLAKPARDFFAYDAEGARIKNFSTVVGATCEFEAEFMPFYGAEREGWFVQLLSLQVI